MCSKPLVPEKAKWRHHSKGCLLSLIILCCSKQRLCLEGTWVEILGDSGSGSVFNCQLPIVMNSILAGMH